MLIVIIILVAVLTNPSKEAHQAAVSDSIAEYMQQEADKNIYEESLLEKAGEEIGMALGNTLLKKVIDYAVDRDNYIVFSLTTLTWEREDRIIGIGMFGKVIIFGDLNQSIHGQATY